MSDSILILKDLLKPQKPVSFEEFVVSPDYCNNPSIYKYWIDNIQALPEHCSELILDGSLGSGKSFCGAHYLAYRVYKLFLNGSPQKQLSLAPNSDIYCLYFSTSMTMAKRSGYTYLYDTFKNCKWFQNNTPINEGLRSSIEFVDRHFYINYASSFGHQLGLNVFAFLLDEANFRQGVGVGTEQQYEEVTELYQQLLDRQSSRFSNADGTVNALAILISSASYQSSFVERRKEAIKSDHNSGVITTVTYEVRPEKYSKETFEVFIGAGVVEPCIVNSPEHKQILLQTADLLGTGEEEKFFRNVPINLRKQFEFDIVLALQNHCGVPTMLKSSFMSNTTFLYKSFVDDIVSIFQSEHLVASTADDTQLIEYLIPDNIVKANNPHCIFLDLSVQNDVGAICCFRYDGKVDNVDIHTRVFSLHIEPPSFPAQTNITKVKNLIVDLAQYLNIVAFASDQYMSTQIRQDIQEELGLSDIRISIDSSDVPHLHWQRGLVEGKIRQPKDEYLVREATEAIRDVKRHRILKATKSSDDVFQANVGAYYLSDTFGKQQGSLEDLYSKDRLNLVGSRSLNKVLSSLGYQQE